ncbi:MAG TPA: hypothetical protein VMR37_00175 [Rhabdochlamydiaceae bacterium]|nr:hypothetical protein [Rhabdochlamydiaceae bacterium]
MSGYVKIQSGQTVTFDAAQMQQLQISSFNAEQEFGTGTSNLPEYTGYHFTWFKTWDYIRPVAWWNDQVSTFQRTNFVYHVTRSPLFELPPLNTPTLLSSDRVISWAIRKEDGLSDRPDLKDYHFEVKPVGPNYSRCLVTMQRIF